MASIEMCKSSCNNCVFDIQYEVTLMWRGNFSCAGSSYAKESTFIGESFDVSDPSFQESTGRSPISRWVAKYYAPLFDSNVFKICVVSPAAKKV